MANRIHHQNIWSSDLDTGRADWEHIPDILRYALRALLQSIETERLQRKTYETDLKQTIQKIETNIQSIQNNINENEQRYRKTVAELRDQKDILSKIKQDVASVTKSEPSTITITKPDATILKRLDQQESIIQTLENMQSSLSTSIKNLEQKQLQEAAINHTLAIEVDNGLAAAQAALAANASIPRITPTSLNETISTLTPLSKFTEFCDKVNASLALKADTSSLAMKVDTTTLNQLLETKVNKTTVVDALQSKVSAIRLPEILSPIVDRLVTLETSISSRCTILEEGIQTLASHMKENQGWYGRKQQQQYVPDEKNISSLMGNSLIDTNQIKHQFAELYAKYESLKVKMSYYEEKLEDTIEVKNDMENLKKKNREFITTLNKLTKKMSIIDNGSADGGSRSKTINDNLTTNNNTMQWVNESILSNDDGSTALAAARAATNALHARLFAVETSCDALRTEISALRRDGDEFRDSSLRTSSILRSFEGQSESLETRIAELETVLCLLGPTIQKQQQDIENVKQKTFTKSKENDTFDNKKLEKEWKLKPIYHNVKNNSNDVSIVNDTNIGKNFVEGEDLNIQQLRQTIKNAVAGLNFE